MIKKWRDLLFEEMEVYLFNDFCDERQIKIDKLEDRTAEIENLFLLWKENIVNQKLWFKNYIDSLDDNEYSALFGHFYHEIKERQIFIEREIDGKRPSFGYLFLSGLISKKRFSRILTTNFDDLLNEALVKWYEIKPLVCAFDSAVSSVRTTSQRVKIIKLHGDFLYDNIKNMDDETLSLETNMEAKMLEMCKDAGLIVVGYSGNDESIMATIKNMLRSKSGHLGLGLHWCKLKGEELSPKVQELANTYKKKFHIYEIKDFDYLMQVIFEKCGCELPNGFTQPQKYNIINEFIDSITKVQGSIESLEPFRKEIIYKINDSASQYDVGKFKINSAHNYWHQGESARKERKFEIAQNKFSSCKTLINELLEQPTNIPVDELLRLFSRKSALFLSIIQLQFDSQTNPSKEYLNSLIKECENSEIVGLKLINDHSEIPPSFIILFYYNMCCFYSVKSKIKNEIDDNTRNKVINYFAMMAKLDIESIEINLLIEDDDFKYFYNDEKNHSSINKIISKNKIKK